MILGVKPYTLPHLLEEIRGALREDQILVSLAAAVPIALIEKVIERRMPIFRAMPNIPVVVEEGATAVASNGSGTAAQRQMVESIFRAVGVVAFVEEDLMHAVTEFVREPHPGHPLDISFLTPGIAYSIPMMLIGLWLIWRARRRPSLATP